MRPSSAVPPPALMSNSYRLSGSIQIARPSQLRSKPSSSSMAFDTNTASRQRARRLSASGSMHGRVAACRFGSIKARTRWDQVRAPTDRGPRSVAARDTLGCTAALHGRQTEQPTTPAGLRLVHALVWSSNLSCISWPKGIRPVATSTSSYGLRSDPRVRTSSPSRRVSREWGIEPSSAGLFCGLQARWRRSFGRMPAARMTVE